MRLPSLVSTTCQSKLLMGLTRYRYRSLGEEGQQKEQISLLGILQLICVWLSHQSADWQAIQLSGSKKERKTIIISIISPFLRLPLSIICAHQLMGFVYSETNFTVNITIMPRQFTSVQSRWQKNEKKEREKKNRKRQRENRTEMIWLPRDSCPKNYKVQH